VLFVPIHPSTLDRIFYHLELAFDNSFFDFDNEQRYFTAMSMNNEASWFMNMFLP
jgi:hypothetical protein